MEQTTFKGSSSEIHNTPFNKKEAQEKARVLKKKIPPELISYRKGAGGARLAYLEGWRAISIANEVFGFNGWSSTIQNITVDYMDVANDGRVSLGLSSVVRVTLKDGTQHEDVGYGTIENAKSKAMAFEKARKEAATDGLKRALRMFGDVLGNCLYNRNFVGKVGKYQRRPLIEEYTEDDFYRYVSAEKPQSPENRKQVIKQPRLDYKDDVSDREKVYSARKPTTEVTHAENQLDRLLSQDDFEWENTLDEIIGVIEYDQPTPRSTANPSGPFGNPQTTIFNNSASLSESTPSQPVFIKSEANSHAKASFKDSFIGRPATGGEPHQMAEGNTGSNYETGGKNSGGGFGNSNSSGFVLASKIHK